MCLCGDVPGDSPVAEQRPNFNPARLTLARRRRGMSKVDLGSAVSLTARRIAAFENQGDFPPLATVEALAAALRFPTRFFYQRTPPEPSPDAVSFRSFARLPAGKRDAALAASALAVELAAWFDKRFELPGVDIPDLREVDPTTAALFLRSAWALGDNPLPNLIHLMEAHGVRVYSLTDDCKELDGFSFWYDGAPYVFLTHHKSPERGRWDGAHELGHLVLHQGVPKGRQTEAEADAFASEFLMPERAIRDTAPYPSLGDVRREKLAWQVSAMAYIRRIHQLGLVSDRQYKSLVIEASQADYRRREGDIEYETSQLATKVLAILRDEGVTVTDIAAELAIAPGEVRGLMFASLASVFIGE